MVQLAFFVVLINTIVELGSMMGHLHGHDRFHLQHRDPRPSPHVEPSALAKALDATMIRLSNLSKRASDDSGSDHCTKNDTSDQCTPPSRSNNITLPVLLGVLYVLLNVCGDHH